MSQWRASILAVLLASTTVGAAAQTPKPATGSLTIAFAAEATMLDPTKSSAGVDQYYFGQIYEQLVRPDPSLKRVNWLAESWSVEDEGGKPVIDVHLRKGVKFHTGDPLTADDFAFAYNRLRDNKISKWSHLQASVEQFEIVDPLHFRIHFKQGDGSYVADNLQLWAMSKAYFDRVGDEVFGNTPVGTGPWKFVSRTIKEDLKLEAFDDYWNPTQRPTVKNLTVKIIPEDRTRVAAFKTGAVDWIDSVPPSMVEEFKKMPGVTTASYVSPNNMYIAMDAIDDNVPMHDVRVRQAAAYAIDVDAITKSVLFGQAVRYAEVGPGEAGYDPELKPYPYDPKKARALLAEAGYPRGFDIPCYNLTTQREPYQKEMGEAVFAYLSAAGIRCKVQGQEYGAWISFGRRDRPGHIDGFYSNMWGHGLPGDAGTPWAGHVHTYVPGAGWGITSVHSDPELDAMIEQLKTTMDLQQRDDLIRKIARIKHERVAGGLTTYRPIVTFAWHDNVTFVGWPSPGFWRNLQQIGLKP